MNHRTLIRAAALTILLCMIGSAQQQLQLAPEIRPDYRARRQALAQKAKGAVVLLFASPEEKEDYLGFRQENNFYYLSGLPEPGGALLIAGATEGREGRPGRQYTEILFLPGRNEVGERWTGPKFTTATPNVGKLTGFDRVEPLDKLRDELVRILPSGSSMVLTDPGDESNSKVPLEWLRRANAFSRTGFGDVRPLLAESRLVKDAEEMRLIRHGVEATKAAHRAAMAAVKPGVSEQEISALLQFEWGRRGCNRPAYPPIVGSGFDSTVLHYNANTKTMKAGDVLVIDAGSECRMYATDITRTLPVSGKFTPRQREIYEIVLGAVEAAIKAFQPGRSTMARTGPDSLHVVAYNYINTHGKDKHGQPLGKYFIHGLGHWVGLQVHDVGDYSKPIPNGAVFTIEPGIYIPEENLGVRIEEMMYVDENGRLINLSADLPRTPDEVEKAMAGQAQSQQPK